MNKYQCNRCYGKGSYEKETNAGPELYQCDFCSGTGSVDIVGLEELRRLGWIKSEKEIRCL